jgi:chemotaxis protein MotA
VFIAYGFLAPFAARLGQIVDEEGQFYKIIKDVLVAHLHGNAAQVSIEIGRGQIPSAAQPSFSELEETLGAVTV